MILIPEFGCAVVKSQGHLGNAGLGSHQNFGHWLLNYFSRMILVRERKDLTSIPVVVADDLSGTRLECLTRLGYGEDQIVRVPAGQIAWFENLWVPSLPYFVSPKADALVWTPEVIHFLRSALGASSKRRDDKPPRRLFITRRHTKWRRLNNEDEVFAAVQPLGFERIDPGELSLDEQINLASEMEIIMGPMGAGMNLHYFAPKETKVIEMKLKLPDNDMEINRPIAAEIGQQYHGIFGVPDDPRGVHLDSDFVVSPDMLLSLLGSSGP